MGAVLFTTATGIVPRPVGTHVPAVAPMLRNKALTCQKHITFSDALIAALNDICKRPEAIVRQPRISNGILHVGALLGQFYTSRQGKHIGMVHNALQNVVNERTGHQTVKDTFALLTLLLDIALTLAFKKEIRGICRPFVNRNRLRDDKVIIDMYAGFVRPAKPDILAITDDDANCFPMIIIIRIQQILIRDIVVTGNLLPGTA